MWVLVPQVWWSVMVNQPLCRSRGGVLDQLAAFEAGSGADEGHEVVCVHGLPPLLGGLDELEDLPRQTVPSARRG
ncbi:hypothetical protein T261_8418 [Streptomyces lydicus]|nr:hypothetical protein T261_8418 [Streptomyces lydicus]